MQFEWDAAKEESNRRKHGIDFKTASRVFFDPCKLELYDDRVKEEDRWIIIGAIGPMLMILTVVYTERGETGEVFRIISARKATSHEQKTYYKIYPGS